MATSTPHLLLVATGGTIAGRAASAQDNIGYRAEMTAADLVAAVPALAGVPLRTVQLAQLDSKDMSHAVWQALVRLLVQELARDDVTGVVITHGTDTLEETAYFLQRVLAPTKPVVLTAAMRPATSLQADGPQNLVDAFTVVRAPDACGVLVVLGGQVHAGDEVRKIDGYRLQAFDSAPAGLVALVEEGRLCMLRAWPQGRPLGAACCERPLADWPRVAWLTSHAGFDAALVDAAVAVGFHGLLLAGTGNGTLHADLEAAAARAAAAGVALRLSTRCASGRVVGHPPRSVTVSATHSAAQARVALLLELLVR